MVWVATVTCFDWTGATGPVGGSEGCAALANGRCRGRLGVGGREIPQARSLSFSLLLRSIVSSKAHCKACACCNLAALRLYAFSLSCFLIVLIVCFLILLSNLSPQKQKRESQLHPRMSSGFEVEDCRLLVQLERKNWIPKELLTKCCSLLSCHRLLNS